MEPSEETEDQEPRPIFFEFRTEIDAFETTFMDLIRKLIQGANPLPPENTQRITHGMTWTHHARPELGRGQIETHSATWELGFHEVVDGDLTALPRSAQVIVTGFQRHLMTSLYQVVSDASDAVGNTVSAAEEGGFAAAFLEGFRRIELAVGRDGIRLN